MSQLTTSSRPIAELLTQYARGFAQNVPEEALLAKVDELLPSASNADEFREIAGRVWDEYFGVDVDLMIRVLRRWRELEPSSKEAKFALGSYLLCHGPDWDDEGNRLLQEAGS